MKPIIAHSLRRMADPIALIRPYEMGIFLSDILFPVGEWALAYNSSTIELWLFSKQNITQQERQSYFMDIATILTKVQSLSDQGILLAVDSSTDIKSATQLFYAGRGDFLPQNGGKKWKVADGNIMSFSNNTGKITVNGSKTDLVGQPFANGKVAIMLLKILLTSYAPTSEMIDYVNREFKTQSEASLSYAKKANKFAAVALLVAAASPFIQHSCVRTTIDAKQFNQLIESITQTSSHSANLTSHSNETDFCKLSGRGVDAKKYSPFQLSGSHEATRFSFTERDSSFAGIQQGRDDARTDLSIPCR